MQAGKIATATTAALLAAAATYDLLITQTIPPIYTLITAVTLLTASIALINTLINHKTKLALQTITATIILTALIYYAPKSGLAISYNAIAIGIGFLYLLAVLRTTLD